MSAAHRLSMFQPLILAPANGPLATTLLHPIVDSHSTPFELAHDNPSSTSLEQRRNTKNSSIFVKPPGQVDANVGPFLYVFMASLPGINAYRLTGACELDIERRMAGCRRPQCRLLVVARWK